MDLRKKTVKELKQMCRDKKIPRYSNKKKCELVKMLTKWFAVNDDSKQHMDTIYELDPLKKRIKEVITTMFSSFDFDKKRKTYFNILDTDNDRENRNKLLKQRQIDMIQGALWQKVFGCVDGMTDLCKGHWSGVDLHHYHRKEYYEIKNSSKTDNSSSRSANEQKLCRIKKQHPDHTCIYGIVNGVNGSSRNISKEIDGVVIHIVSGNELFHLVFGKNWQEILRFVILTYQECRYQFVI